MLLVIQAVHERTRPRNRTLALPLYRERRKARWIIYQTPYWRGKETYELQRCENIRKKCHVPHVIAEMAHLHGTDNNGSHERRSSEEREQRRESALEQNQREEARAREGQHGWGDEGRRRPAELLEDDSSQDHHDQGDGTRGCAEVTLGLLDKT